MSDRYDSMPGVNPSSLKVLWQKSPLHYRESLTAPHVETKAMAFGTAVHMAILQPELFTTHYVIRPEGMDGRTAEGKAWAREHAGQPILTADEHRACLEMLAAVERHPVARQILAAGHVERPIQWMDAETGVECKGRPDLYTHGRVLVDLKTAADIRPRPFAAQAARLGYHFSEAMYFDGLEAMGERPEASFLVVLEKEPPFDVAVYRIGDAVRAQGREEYRDALAALCVCRNTGIWPGVAPGEVELELPRWAMPEDEDADGLDFGDAQ